MKLFGKDKGDAESSTGAEGGVDSSDDAAATDATGVNGTGSQFGAAAAGAPLSEPGSVDVFDMVDKPELVVAAAFVGGLIAGRLVRSLGR